MCCWYWRSSPTWGQFILPHLSVTLKPSILPISISLVWSLCLALSFLISHLATFRLMLVIWFLPLFFVFYNASSPALFFSFYFYFFQFYYCCHLFHLSSLNWFHSASYLCFSLDFCTNIHSLYFWLDVYQSVWNWGQCLIYTNSQNGLISSFLINLTLPLMLLESSLLFQFPNIPLQYHDLSQ